MPDPPNERLPTRCLRSGGSACALGADRTTQGRSDRSAHRRRERSQPRTPDRSPACPLHPANPHLWEVRSRALATQRRGRAGPCLDTRPRISSGCGQCGRSQGFSHNQGGHMSAVHVLEGGRHPAVLDVPAGALEVTARPAGAVKLSLVIPTFNESRNLAELIGRLSAVLDGCLPGAYELLVVDDDSPDETWALALRMADRVPALRVMRRRGEKGLSTAVIRGWQAARGEVLAVIDADLQHPPEVVERLWREIGEGADLAVASPHTGGGGGSGRLALLPQRFAKFAAVGLSGVAVDMAILWLLKGRLGWPLTPAKLVAAEMAMANNFLWNDLWTFGDLAEKQGYGMARLRRFAKFNGICAAGLALSVGLLEMQVGLFRINTYVANAVAIGVTTGWNFWMNKIFSWSLPQPLSTAVPAQRRAAGA